MPAVLTFWWLPDEEDDFLRYLEEGWESLAVLDEWAVRRRDISPQPISSYIDEHDPDYLLFGLPHHVSEEPVVTCVVDGKLLYGLTPERSRVIAYSRGKIAAGQRLTLSNLAAYWDRLDEAGTRIVPKDPEFVKWGKKVFAWVRRHTPDWHEYKSYRASTQVKEAFLNGEVELVSY